MVIGVLLLVGPLPERLIFGYVTVTLPLHCRYTAVTFPLQVGQLPERLIFGMALAMLLTCAVTLPLHCRYITVTLPLLCRCVAALLAPPLASPASCGGP